MEIVDYLRVARRRLWVLVGVPVVAAAAATAIVLLAPQRYAGTAYVAAPALVGGAAAQQFTGVQAANQFVAAFGAAVTAPKVVEQVSADTGVGAGALRDGLKVTQVGASSQLELRYTSTDRDTVSPVLAATAEHALEFLFSSQVEVGDREVETATGEVTAATAAITDWEKTNKVSQPDKLYQALLSESASLRRQQLEMAAVGNSGGAASSAAAIAALQKRLDALGPKLPEYQALIAQRDSATAALAKAREGLQAARAQVQAADPAKVASVGETERVSRTGAVIRTVVPVAGAGVLVAVLLVALLELVARNRRAVAAAAAPADAATPAAVPAPRAHAVTDVTTAGR
ncbi:Chain length determinant protein [Micromonospora pattaloongensis]|uniref:Chain length determinant protein n=1 Tax=Micromonospora pattaloongensis TaxID=405436 RepID=A0A1H3RGY1_9ACTN|nr:Wzz/FepE/Etk N-terminal domain-containing protein [Micromonospora pattaloongensis]SDZ24994.1 Chain length determinant protein [Micromonospora pattaloongensis]